MWPDVSPIFILGELWDRHIKERGISLTPTPNISHWVYFDVFVYLTPSFSYHCNSSMRVKFPFPNEKSTPLKESWKEYCSSIYIAIWREWNCDESWYWSPILFSSGTPSSDSFSFIHWHHSIGGDSKEACTNALRRTLCEEYLHTTPTTIFTRKRKEGKYRTNNNHEEQTRETKTCI